MRALALFLAAAVSLPPIQAATRRHIAGRGSGSDSPFGVNVVVTSRSNGLQVGLALDLAHAANIGWTRIPFPWSAIQPTGSTADFALPDQIVNRAAQNNLRVLGLLGYATPWNTTAPATETRPAQREHYPPADYDAWSRFVFTTVVRYRNTVHYWEIWNQPDLGSTPDAMRVCNGFWCGTAAQYARLLSVAYRAIKSADPTASVLFGGLALGGAEQNVNFMFDVLTDPDNPGTQSFDVMNFHVYGSKTEALKRLNFVKSQLAFGGAGLRPIWITEFGYPSDSALQNVAPYTGGDAGQAAYVRDMAPYLLSLGARKVFWFQLVDSDPAVSPADPFASYGLLTLALAKKPAYDAYAETIRSYRP